MDKVASSCLLYILLTVISVQDCRSESKGRVQSRHTEWNKQIQTEQHLVWVAAAVIKSQLCRNAGLNRTARLSGWTLSSNESIQLNSSQKTSAAPALLSREGNPRSCLLWVLGNPLLFPAWKSHCAFADAEAGIWLPWLRMVLLVSAGAWGRPAVVWGTSILPTSPLQSNSPLCPETSWCPVVGARAHARRGTRFVRSS